MGCISDYSYVSYIYGCCSLYSLYIEFVHEYGCLNLIDCLYPIPGLICAWIDCVWQGLIKFFSLKLCKNTILIMVYLTSVYSNLVLNVNDSLKNGKVEL